MGEVGFGCDLDGSASQPAVLGVHHVPVAEEILGQEDGSGHIAGARQAPQVTAERQLPFGAAALRGLRKRAWFAATPLDGASGDPKPGGHLFIRALQRAELLQFYQIDVDRLSPGT